MESVLNSIAAETAKNADYLNIFGELLHEDCTKTFDRELTDIVLQVDKGKITTTKEAFERYENSEIKFLKSIPSTVIRITDDGLRIIIAKDQIKKALNFSKNHFRHHITQFIKSRSTGAKTYQKSNERANLGNQVGFDKTNSRKVRFVDQPELPARK